MLDLIWLELQFYIYPNCGNVSLFGVNFTKQPQKKDTEVADWRLSTSYPFILVVYLLLYMEILMLLFLKQLWLMHS
jgi:hypothetical protein